MNNYLRRERTLSFTVALILSAATHAAANTASAPQAETQAKIALTVADKSCSRIVQPYDVKSNAAELAGNVVTRGVGRAKDFFSRKVNGQAAKANQEKEITEEARNEAKRLNWLPMNAEVMYGQRAHDTVVDDILSRDSKKGKQLYPAADELLKQLNAPIAGQHEYSFQVFILKNASQNASARPGGFLYLDQGLLTDPKQKLKARFALAHELAHVLQRHETKELQAMIVDSFTAKDEMQKAILRAKDDPASLLQNVKVGKDVYVRHANDQELQADSCAARLLSEAFTQPGELALTINAFIKQLPPIDGMAVKTAASTPVATAPVNLSANKDEANAQKALQASAVAYSIVASPAERHPNSKERTENLQAMYAELTKKPPEKAVAALSVH